MRFAASHNPFINPCFFNAMIAYSEHVGVNLHEGGFSGDKQIW
jgi:hypothetical protein